MRVEKQTHIPRRLTFFLLWRDTNNIYQLNNLNGWYNTIYWVPVTEELSRTFSPYRARSLNPLNSRSFCSLTEQDTCSPSGSSSLCSYGVISSQWALGICLSAPAPPANMEAASLLCCLLALHVAMGANSCPYAFVTGIWLNCLPNPLFTWCFPLCLDALFLIIHFIRIYNANTQSFSPVSSFTQVVSWVDSVGLILSDVHFVVMPFQACRFYVFFILDIVAPKDNSYI